MKGKIIGLSIVALAMLIMGRAAAFDLEGALKKTAEAGGATMVENKVNNSLKEHNCKFKKKTASLDCDMEALIDDLQSKKEMIEDLSNAQVTFKAMVGKGSDKSNEKLGQQRLDLVQKELIKEVTWGKWDDKLVAGDKLEVKIEIK